MDKGKNFFGKAYDAIIAGRERQARQYLAQYERTYGKLNDQLTKR